jgi:cell division transport system permease protein
MFWLTTKRIIKSGFVNFWRNSFVSLASVLVMTVTLFVMGSLLFTGQTLETSLERLKQKVDVNVYFVTDAPEEEIRTLQSQLQSMPEVQEVSYTSRQEALNEFREEHANDQLTLQALDELDENPLGANLSIKAEDTSQYQQIAQFLRDETGLAQGQDKIIDKINFFQNQTAINRLDQIIESSETFGLSVTVVLIVASVLITFNTIRLAIYTSREEIAVMQLVGASNAYIRGPFVVEGILYGIVSAIITLILFYPMTYWLGPVTQSFFGSMNLFTYYISNFGQIAVLIVGAGIALGAVSSYLAVKKYLKT